MGKFSKEYFLALGEPNELYNTTILLGLNTEKWNVWHLCKKLVAFFGLANINEMLTWMTWLLLSGQSLRALSNNTFYGWVCLIFPWWYGWNWLLFAMGVDKKVTGDSKHVMTAMVVIVTMWRNDQSNTEKNGIVCTEGIYRQVSVHTLQ